MPELLASGHHGARHAHGGSEVSSGTAALNVVVATLIGGTSGFLGGKLDLAVQRFVDAIRSTIIGALAHWRPREACTVCTFDRESKYVRAWIGDALGLAAHTDGAIHAGADNTLAIGMQQGPRPEQQDCGVALLWVPRGGVFSPRCAAVIADGMGGMEDGGWASRHTVGIVVERCLSGEHDMPRDMLASALAAAQREVLEALDGRGGTTLTVAVWYRQSGMLVHTGDTRAHLIEPGRPFRCLTTDHTDAGLADMLDGLTTGRPAEPYQPTAPDNSLIDAIGVPDGVLAERHVLHTPRDGRCVMTTDGAHDPVRWAGTAAFEEGQNEERWTARRSVEALWERLADETLTDNATVVAIEPGRALQQAEEDLRFGDVLLVGPTGVLRQKLS